MGRARRHSRMGGGDLARAAAAGRRSRRIRPSRARGHPHLGLARPGSPARVRRGARRGPRSRAVRVTHLGKFYPPVAGGMERVLQALCEGERALGTDSQALVAAIGRTTVRESVNGVPVTRAGSILRIGSVWLSAALVKFLRQDDGDVLVL